jgi:hypothetical protein
MSRRAILSFLIASAPYESDTGLEGDPEQMGITVTPVIDGTPMPNIGVFDAVDMLIYGASTAESELYTCSCGNAGCAGFHEPVQLQAVGETMTWLFPERPFRAQLGPALVPSIVPAEVPLAVMFDREQYVKALATLESDLAAAFKASPIPAVVIPGWSCEQLGAKSFRAMLKAARKRRAEWDASRLARANAEGPLRDLQYQVHLPKGWDLFREMGSFAWEQACGMADSEDAQIPAVRDVIGPKLLADGLDTISSMSASERARLFFAESLNLSDEVWLSATYSIVTNAEAKAIRMANHELDA